MSDNRLRLVDDDRAPSFPPADPLIGRTLDGRYRVEDVLGEGGMGIVYRAKHAVLGKSLAIKVLRHDVSKDADVIGRFRQEAQSASAIGNQHIIDISDFGSLPDGSTYFVMEFLDGNSLTHTVEQNPTGVASEQVIHIGKQLCEALDAAHSQNIVHRDLKPDNVYLVRRGEDSAFVKVLDFGIAKVGGATSKLTKAGQVFGTPHYMSPEQCAGHAIDHRSDIYAMGIILYEMATGKVPFDSDTLMGILTKHIYEAPVPARELNPSIFPHLEQVISRCLAKNPDDRYPTMAAAREDLERARLGLLPMTMPSFVPGNNAAAPMSEMGIRDNKNVVLFAAAAVGVGCLLAAGVWWAARDPLPAAGNTVVLARDPQRAVATAPRQAEHQLPEITAPAAPTRSEHIRIVSVPEGAEVYLDGSLVGNTPMQIARPASGASAAVELRMVEFNTNALRVADVTQDEITVTLERTRRVPSARRPQQTAGERPPQTNGELLPVQW